MATKALSINPDVLIPQVIAVVEDKPDVFWAQIETVIQDILDGEPNAQTELLDMIGLMPSEYNDPS